jgi:hypothetical protein
MRMKIKIWFALGFRRFSRVGRAEKVKISPIKGGRLKARVNLIRRDVQEQEIYGSCIILKNLSIVQKNLPISTDSILEELMDNSNALKGIYGEMLFRWRNGWGTESFSVMGERIDSKAARNFASILSKAEQINPAELVESMTMFEESFSGDRMTRAMRRASRKSLITTMAATAAVFAVLMNFSIVVVFMDMINMLGGLEGGV